MQLLNVQSMGKNDKFLKLQCDQIQGKFKVAFLVQGWGERGVGKGGWGKGAVNILFQLSCGARNQYVQ